VMRKKIESDLFPKMVKDGDTVTGTGFSYTTPEELFILTVKTLPSGQGFHC